MLEYLGILAVDWVAGRSLNGSFLPQEMAAEEMVCEVLIGHSY